MIISNYFKPSHLLLALACYTIPYFGYAASGISVDPNGDTIPSPTGNIPYFQMPDALSSGNGEYTWDYSGTLQDANNRYSFQSSIFQLSKNNQAALGMHMFDFAFQNNGAWFYSDSTYGNETGTMQATAESLDNVSSTTSLNQFFVSATLISNPKYQWQFSSMSLNPTGSLYKGFVGQPGHEYLLNGTGVTYLWRYDQNTGQSTVEPYTYSFSVTLLDERGATMEGLGNGYVGPSLIPTPKTAGYNVEIEIAQPRLRVLNWHVTFNAVKTNQTGYQSQYTFSGNNGMLWNDFGPVDKGGKTPTQKSQLLSNLIQINAPTTAALNQNASTQVLNAATHDAKGLYNGNWLPIEFTSGKYKGASAAFFVFWNPGAPYSIGQSTSDPHLSLYGWANFFAGYTPNQVDTAFSMLETLYPENPIIPSMSTTEKTPYKVVFNQYEPSKYHLSGQWVKNLTITIKANTPLRYAFAAYANSLANNTTADDPSKDLVINFNAVSPVAQNTLFSNNITQYYEGAAIPTIKGKNVGYAWIEQMQNS